MSLGRPRADTLAKVESCPLFKPPADHSTLWMDENIFGGKWSIKNKQQTVTQSLFNPKISSNYNEDRGREM